MPRALALISLVTLAAALAACASSHSMPDDGGTGGDAEPPRDGDMPPPDDGGTGGDAEPPPPPPECAVETDREGPFDTTFRFANDGDEELWVLRTCRLQMTLQSCASDYRDVSMWGDCTIDCSEGGGSCVACGACMFQPVEVTPGDPAETTWPGNTYTFDETASGCPCHVETPAEAGKYRATIRVYASEEAARSDDALRVVEHDFELPAPDGVVTVPLAE